MSESRPPVDPKLSFAAGWLLGRRGRNRSGAGCLFLVIGVFAALTSIFGLVSAPLSWMDSRAVRRLPQPVATELSITARGTELLMPAQLPPEDATDGHGLVLFYSEAYADEGAGSEDTGWQRESQPQSLTEVSLDDGTLLSIQLPQNAKLHNATTVDDPDDEGRRYVGYLPGQAVILRGSWEGDSLMTAEALYAGTIDDNLRYLSRQPGYAVLAGMVCGGIALIFLMIGGVLRFVGV
jgi:hypothetical protein